VSVERNGQTREFQFQFQFQFRHSRFRRQGVTTNIGRTPTILRLVLCTTTESQLLDDDWVGMSEAGVNGFAIYSGATPCVPTDTACTGFVRRSEANFA